MDGYTALPETPKCSGLLRAILAASREEEEVFCAAVGHPLADCFAYSSLASNE